MKLKSIIIAGLVLQSGLTFAAPPNMVGTWEAVSGYWAGTGTEMNPAPAELSQKPVQQKLVIGVQEESAFHGVSIRQGGESRNLAGVIGPDGRSLVFSIDYGTGSGTLSADGTQMTNCGTTIQLTRNFAFCTVFKKAK